MRLNAETAKFRTCRRVCSRGARGFGLVWEKWRAIMLGIGRMLWRLPTISRTTIAAIGLLSGLAAAPALADDAVDDEGVWSFVWENDIYGGTDQNYTNGLRVGWVSPPAPRDGAVVGFVEGWLPLDANDEIRYGLALGHSIFTPESTTERNAPPDEHPYAGFVYGELSFYIDHGEAAETVALQIGWVGPSAQGEWVQNNFHDLINSYEVLGWDDQLNDEPVAALIFERRERALFKVGFGDLELDATPNFGATLGNLRTQANLGVTVRFGDQLESDFGPPRVRPALGGVSYFKPTNGLSWYLFAGVEGRAVAHNIFLDGNTFSDSPSVDRKPFVADLQLGAVIRYADVQLGYTAVVRSEEFKTQDDFQRFGAVNLSVRF